jgi:hypothetical protein
MLLPFPFSCRAPRILEGRRFGSSLRRAKDSIPLHQEAALSFPSHRRVLVRTLAVLLATLATSSARGDIINLVNSIQANVTQLVSIAYPNNPSVVLSQSNSDSSQGSSSLPLSVSYSDANIAGSASMVASKTLNVHNPNSAVLDFTTSSATNVSSLMNGWRPEFDPADAETVEFFTLTSSYSFRFHEQASAFNAGGAFGGAGGSGYFFSYAANAYVDLWGIGTLAQYGAVSRDVTLTGVLGPGTYVIATLSQTATGTDFVAGDSGNALGFAEQTLTLTSPEPASLTLLALGGAGVFGYAWRRRKVGERK